MKTEIPSEALEQMKREGWPSIEEQEQYWENQETNQERIDATCDWFDHCSLADQETDAERNR